MMWSRCPCVQAIFAILTFISRANALISSTSSPGSMQIASSSSRLPVAKIQRVPVRVVCTPGSNMLEYTHTFLSAYAATHYRPQIAQRISVAVYELLENAMNYGGISSEIVLELSDSPGSACVRVSNESIAARISMLTAHVARVHSNAEATFMEEMKRSVMGELKVSY